MRELRDWAIVGLMLGTWGAIGVPFLAYQALRRELPCPKGRGR